VREQGACFGQWFTMACTLKMHQIEYMGFVFFVIPPEMYEIDDAA
jgi:hypothetical protein